MFGICICDTAYSWMPVYLLLLLTTFANGGPYAETGPLGCPAVEVVTSCGLVPGFANLGPCNVDCTPAGSYCKGDGACGTNANLNNCASGVARANQDCWDGCGGKQGWCSWCGNGVCCYKGWGYQGDPCDGSIGGSDNHACAAKMCSVYKTTTATSCSSPGNYDTRGSQLTSCPPGTYTSGSSCTACQIGTYQEGSGAASCTVCPAGSDAEFPGAISSSVCRFCPAWRLGCPKVDL